MKRKSIICIILLSLCLVGMNIGTVQAQESTNISVEMPENAKVGEVITAKIMVDHVDETAVGLKFDVTYDNNVLEYVSDQAGENIKGTMNLSKHVPEEQRIRVGIVALLGLKESGCYYELQFKVKEVATTTTKVDVKISELTDSKGNELSYMTNGANMSIEGTNNPAKDTKQEETEEVKNSDNIESENVSYEEKEENNIAKIQIALQGENTQNIKDYFTQEQAEDLTWSVEDVQIVELKEDGTITPKQIGTTHVLVKDADGNIVNQIPLEVIGESTKKENKVNMPVMIAIIIVCVILGTIIGYKVTRLKMQKNNTSK